MSAHFRPRAAPPSSPVRPATSHSMRSTVRTVPPSPESMEETSDECGIAGGDMPPLKNEDQTLCARSGGSKHAHHESNSDVAIPRTRRYSSPRKSRSQSPRKQPLATPPSHLPSYGQESPTREGRDAKDLECPDTPSPIPVSQQRLAYAPLRVCAAAASGEGNPTTLLRKTHSRPLLCGAHVETRRRAEVSRRVVPDGEVARRVGVAGQSGSSTASVAARRAVFLTPGRDELERKKVAVEVDDGPFARAVSMRDLEERRKIVGEGTDGEDKMDKKKRKKMKWGCGGGCGVM